MRTDKQEARLTFRKVETVSVADKRAKIIIKKNLTLKVNTFTGKLRSDCTICTVVVFILLSDHSAWQVCVVAVSANRGCDSQLT